ncbi:MAG: P-II family nitrogen regulator [Clostridiales Family XIII bacterium]|jgi:nitrogen regulatory protein PII 2|nr:P-II family nitrogen regulator [Clostridiales Family XIII bacterium]
MKEVMCFIRANKVNVTKRALAENGFPAFTCRKCLGRGKRSIDPDLLRAVLAVGELPLSPVGENLTEATRLIAKRFFTLVVEDGDADKAVETVIAANQTGNPGDGRVFVLPVLEAYTVRNGEASAEAY